MKSLPPRVRHKAIEISNTLLAAGRPEGQAIRIAIWSAKGRDGGRVIRARRAHGGPSAVAR